MPVTGNKTFHPLSLSIRLYADGFSFFVCNLQAGSLIRGEHFRLEDGQSIASRLAKELGRPDYFNRQIDQVFVLVCSPSTRVPLEAFRREEADSLYELTFAQLDMKTLRVGYNILPHLEVVELYSISHYVEEAILQFYPTARFFGSRAMLLERLLRFDEEATDSGACLYVCAEDEAYTLVAFDKGRLRFANTFLVASETDALYYILSVWKRLDMDAIADRLVFIQSHSASDTSLPESARSYIRNVDTPSVATLFSNVALAREREVPLDLMALLLNRL